MANTTNTTKTAKTPQQKATKTRARKVINLYSDGVALNNLEAIRETLKTEAGKLPTYETLVEILTESYMATQQLKESLATAESKIESLESQLAEAKQDALDTSAELTKAQETIADLNSKVETAPEAKPEPAPETANISQMVADAVAAAINGLSLNQQPTTNQLTTNQPTTNQPTTNQPTVNGFVEPVKHAVSGHLLGVMRDFSAVPNQVLFSSNGKGSASEKVKRSFMALIDWNREHSNTPNLQLAPTQSILRQVSGCNGKVVSAWIEVNKAIINQESPIELVGAGVFNKNKDIAGIVESIRAKMLNIDPTESIPEVIAPAPITSAKESLANEIAADIQKLCLAVGNPEVNQLEIGAKIAEIGHQTVNKIEGLARLSAINPKPSTVLQYRSDIFKMLTDIVHHWEPISFNSINNFAMYVLLESRKFVYNSLGEYSKDKAESSLKSLTLKAANLKPVKVYSMVKWSIETLEKLSDDSDWVEVVVALALMTGCRRSEILCSGQVKFIDDNHISVNGILKTHPKIEEIETPVADEIITVLNGKSSVICAAFEWLRKHPKLAKFQTLDKPYRTARDLNDHCYKLVDKSAEAKTLAAGVKPIMEKHIKLVDVDCDWFDASGRDCKTLHRLREIYSSLVIETIYLIEPDKVNVHERLIRQQALSHKSEGSGRNYDSVFKVLDITDALKLHPQHPDNQG